MRISDSRIRKIIREETRRVLAESMIGDGVGELIDDEFPEWLMFLLDIVFAYPGVTLRRLRDAFQKFTGLPFSDEFEGELMQYVDMDRNTRCVLNARGNAKHLMPYGGVSAPDREEIQDQLYDQLPDLKTGFRRYRS